MPFQMTNSGFSEFVDSLDSLINELSKDKVTLVVQVNLISYLGVNFSLLSCEFDETLSLFCFG